MKKMLAFWMMILLITMLFSGIVLPIAGENASSSNGTRGSPRWSSYKAYYNETFTIQQGWEWENVSMAILVQTTDTTTRNRDSQGSAGTFTSAEVLQSTFDLLDGKTTTTGTSRNVLGELFTATWCGYCPGGVGAFDRITRDPAYFPTKTTMIEFHASGDHGNAAGVTRSNLYGVSGIPTAIFDGYECFTGGSQNPNSTTPENHYKRIINARATKTSVIDISTFGSKDSKGGWINASVELVSPTPVRNLQVQFFVLEDIYPANNSGAFYRYTAQNILTPRAFIPPNHPPTIKTTLPDVEVDEDDSDSNTIKLANAFEDEDLDVLAFSSDRDGGNKQHILVEYDEGNVTFTPDANWNGVEEITFYADDGNVQIEQQITVTVIGMNDAPVVAHQMPDFTMFEDIPVENKFNLSYIFYDIDTDVSLNSEPQDPLEFSYYGDKHIEVTISQDGWVSFDPEPDWNGEETITFAAEDGDSLTAYDDVKIKVRSDNDPPVLKAALPAAELNEDEILEDYVDLNEYFSDQDGDSLTYGIIEPDNIDVKLNYEDDSVFLTIEPEKNYWGTGTITIEATDIPDSTPVVGTIEVTVLSVNDAPILNETDEWNIISSSVLISDDVITVEEDVTLELYVTAYDPADHDVITFSDDTELFDIDSKTGKVEFTPTNADVGQYEVEITIDDGQEKDNTDSYTYTIIVQNVNDPPENVKIIKPEDGKTYVTDTDIEFKASAEDQDMDILGSKEWLSYEWFADELAETLSFNNEFTTSLEPGDYTIKLKVSDSTGANTIVQVKITVDIDKTIDTDKDGTPDHLDDDDDNDGIPDTWELKYNTVLNPLDASDANKDPDKDGFTNLEEYLGTDGLPDGNDDTNPNNKASYPKTTIDDKGSDGDGDEVETDYSTLLYAGLGVIIVVVILILLFAFMRKGKGKSEETPSEQIPMQMAQIPPQPQTQQEQVPIPITQEQTQVQGQEMPQQPMMEGPDYLYQQQTQPQTYQQYQTTQTTQAPQAQQQQTQQQMQMDPSMGPGMGPTPQMPPQYQTPMLGPAQAQQPTPATEQASGPVTYQQQAQPQGQEQTQTQQTQQY